MSVQSQDVYANAGTLITALGSGGGGGNVSSLTVSSIVVNGSTMVTSTMNVNTMLASGGRTGGVFFDVNISSISTSVCIIYGDVDAGFYSGTASTVRATQTDAFLLNNVSSINGVNWAAITSTLHIP